VYRVRGEAFRAPNRAAVFPNHPACCASTLSGGGGEGLREAHLVGLAGSTAQRSGRQSFGLTCRAPRSRTRTGEAFHVQQAPDPAYPRRLEGGPAIRGEPRVRSARIFALIDDRDRPKRRPTDFPQLGKTSAVADRYNLRAQLRSRL